MDFLKKVQKNLLQEKPKKKFNLFKDLVPEQRPASEQHTPVEQTKGIDREQLQTEENESERFEEVNEENTPPR